MQVGDILPLNYQAANYDSTQYVRAYLYDENGDELSSSPANLVPTDDTGGYQNNEVAMPASTSVKAFYKVYSDPSYETLSESLGGSVDIFYLSQDAINNSANIVGYVDNEDCVESPIKDVIVQGADKALVVRLVDSPNGNPFDLSGATELEFRFREADGTVLSLTTDGDAVQIVNALGGTLMCSLTAAQTLLLAPRIPAPFTIVVTKPSGVTVVNIMTQLAVEEAAV